MRPLAGNPLIVALDVDDLAVAEELAGRLAGHVGGLKVGLELFAAAGPAAVERVGRHAPVFLDLKLHDIPTTVERAARACAGLGVAMLTVHASGGAAMVEAAVEGYQAGGGTGIVLGVTVLTSLSDDDLAAMGHPAVSHQVPALARLAVEAGAGGLVCAPDDLAAVRDAVGPEPVLVTPGVRSAGQTRHDHARAATPAAAIAAGADWLVVGRPITAVNDPVAAADAIVAETRGRS